MLPSHAHIRTKGSHLLGDAGRAFATRAKRNSRPWCSFDGNQHWAAKIDDNIRAPSDGA